MSFKILKNTRNKKDSPQDVWILQIFCLFLKKMQFWQEIQLIYFFTVLTSKLNFLKNWNIKRLMAHLFCFSCFSKFWNYFDDSTPNKSDAKINILYIFRLFVIHTTTRQVFNLYFFYSFFFLILMKRNSVHFFPSYLSL